MKVRRLFIWATCLPLIAASGCGPKHAPVKIDVVIPTQGGAPEIQPSSVLAEKGATLTFRVPGDPSDITLEVQFLKNGVAEKVCRPETTTTTTTTLTGPSPLKCQLTTTGDFDLVINEVTSDGKRKIPSPVVKAYIRPCKGCST
jgi:hypothetical protein